MSTSTASPAARGGRTVLRILFAMLIAAATTAPATPEAALAQAADWRDETMYFVMTDRFRNGDPSNDLDSDPQRPNWWHGGDLRGVIEKLDYIKSLGMTALSLTPITAQTEGGYHGYWTNDFFSVDPHLGDMETLRVLVDEAHARGLKVVLDVVVNHVGHDHPWLTDGAHEGWFHEECAMDLADQRSVEECRFAGLPDLNTENTEVRSYLTQWSLWLIEQTGVDGFSLRAARHVPREFVRDWTAAIKRAYPSFWIGGEVFGASYNVLANYLDAGLDAVLDVETYEAVRGGLEGSDDLARLAAPPRLAMERSIEPAQRVLFIDNHDVPRFIGSLAQEPATARLRQALVYLFTMPGIPVVYYGTEVALPGGENPDNRRAMPWDVVSQAEVTDLAKRLAGLRRDNAVFRRGSFVEISAAADHLVYRRTIEGRTVVVALNSTDEGRELVLRSALPGRAKLAAALDAPGAKAAVRRDGTLAITLPPRGAQIWSVGAAEPWPPLWAILVIAVSCGAIGAAAWRLRSLS